MSPLREIIDREILTGHSGCNHGAYSVFLTLSCGHVKCVKGSQAPKYRTRCDECSYLEHNNRIHSGMLGRTQE